MLRPANFAGEREEPRARILEQAGVGSGGAGSQPAVRRVLRLRRSPPGQLLPPRHVAIITAFAM